MRRSLLSGKGKEEGKDVKDKVGGVRSIYEGRWGRRLQGTVGREEKEEVDKEAGKLCWNTQFTGL